MEDFLINYGPGMAYLIMLLGSFVEGESIVLTISALSYRYDSISLPLLMLIAFLGSTCADQLLFFLGKHYGQKVFDRYPWLNDKAERVFEHLHKHSTLFIFSFRFIYGIRVASPIIIGAAKIPTRRFAILNVLAAAIWSAISCSAGYALGYFFADDIEDAFKMLGEYQKHAVFTIFAIICLWAAFKYWRYKRAQD